MKTLVKVGIGTLVGTVIGAAIAFLGKNADNDEVLNEVDETEDYDSYSDEEAE